MKATHVRGPPVGAANPSVVTDEPLISKERSSVPASIPQKSRVNPTMTVSIHTSGRLTSATGP
jgi:hypothetical protein